MFFCRKNSKLIAHNVLLSKKHNPCVIKILYKTIFPYKSSWKTGNAQLENFCFPTGKLFFLSWTFIFSQLGCFLSLIRFVFELYLVDFCSY